MNTRTQILALVDKVKEIISLLDDERLKYKQEVEKYAKKEKETVQNDALAIEVYKQWGAFMKALCENPRYKTRISDESYVVMIRAKDLYAMAKKFGFREEK